MLTNDKDNTTSYCIVPWQYSFTQFYSAVWWDFVLYLLTLYSDNTVLAVPAFLQLWQLVKNIDWKSLEKLPVLIFDHSVILVWLRHNITFQCSSTSSEQNLCQWWNYKCHLWQNVSFCSSNARPRSCVAVQDDSVIR